MLRCLPVLDIGFLPLLGCEQPGGTNCKPLGITGGALAPLHESGGQGKSTAEWHAVRHAVLHAVCHAPQRHPLCGCFSTTKPSCHWEYVTQKRGHAQPVALSAWCRYFLCARKDQSGAFCHCPQQTAQDVATILRCIRCARVTATPTGARVADSGTSAV